MKILKKILCFVITEIVLLLMPTVFVSAAQKQTIYNSPYVDFAPDGEAWTTNAGNQDVRWYVKGTSVSTGIASTLRAPEVGEHYYLYNRMGEIPIGRWEVVWDKVNCCHNAYPPAGEYHGILYNQNLCFKIHYSGWNPFCADCGDKITGTLFYMSNEAAETIDFFEMKSDMDYYYLCPFCSNLEQGTSFYGHACKGISWNQYKIVYDKNEGDDLVAGYMPDSFHMYNNATEYNGSPVTPITHLTENAYTRIGYEFMGWNTEPDGRGQSFQDGEEILNLSKGDWKNRDTWTENDDGTVTLYAQWRKSSGILNIDPNGGSYQDKSSVTVIAGNYCDSYRIMNEKVDAPEGYTVSFETNGGSSVDSITSDGYFIEWSTESPFKGRLIDDTYSFLVPDGNTDTIVANYGFDSVILPGTVKPDYSFGGWYYDPECTKPAGGVGDNLTPCEDIALYAGWVELKLFAEDNYTANEGKGAVDLSWSQTDNNNKTYKLYQSRDNVDWNLITSASDIGSVTEVAQNFGYTGKSETYTVPYSGIYTLTAYGAQGGNCGVYKGGYGGSVTARVWLQRGERLTYEVGGQNGYNGGGNGSVYGNGGGATTIISDRQGLLLVAGGGGGAAAGGNGAAGGSAISLRGDENSEGVHGQAGGGGGYVGGNAGEYIIHTHAASCMHKEPLAYTWYRDANITDSLPDYLSAEAEQYYSRGNWKNGLTVENAFGNGYSPNRLFLGISGYNYSGAQVDTGLIPTKGNTEVFVSAYTSSSEKEVGRLDLNQTRLVVYNQNNKVIYSKAAAQLPYIDATDKKSANYTNFQNNSGISSGHYKGTISARCDLWMSKYFTDGYVVWNEKIPIPSGTTSIRVICKIVSAKDTFHVSSCIECIDFSGGMNTFPVCGYAEGQIISSKPAYGGSNYVNTSLVYEYSQDAGVHIGNGAVSIQSESLGYLEALSLSDVIAVDLAEPDGISVETIKREPLSGTQVKVEWQEPKDNGTDYYHVAESYMQGSSVPLCRSNVTKNTLVSGIKGYYVLTDTSPSTELAASNSIFNAESIQIVDIGEQTKYLHVAAVDKAGNVGGTVHIKIDVQNVAWKLYTEQLSLEAGQNVCRTEDEKTWYVKADGSTPFTLEHKSYIDGPATEEYQPNYIIYESMLNGDESKNIVYSPSVAIRDGEIRTSAEGLFHSVEGCTRLTQYSYSYTVRTNRNRELRGVQSFILNPELSGKAIEIIPIVGAELDTEIYYSDYEADRSNSLTIIGDGEAPVITGLEILENKEIINRNDGILILSLVAQDDLSGVREFYVEVINTDNANKKVYTSGADGIIRIEITRDEPIFGGDFIVRAYAEDCVGNETEVSYATTEFLLTATVERILSPKEPIFKCGESGLIKICTYGYAEKVEVIFPEEMTALQPGLNQIFDYSGRENYMQQESVQFMIPLYTPANMQYAITVRAYKGDKCLEDYPTFSTVSVDGSVLDELRTRLR